MARKLNKTVDSIDIQGKGTYVKYTEPTNAELREFRAVAADFNQRIEGLKPLSEEYQSINDEAEIYQANFLAQFIKEWNWTEDEDGKVPLHQPENNPDVIRELLPTESQWLWNLFNVSVEKKLK